MGVKVYLFILYALCGICCRHRAFATSGGNWASSILEAHLCSSLANANVSDQERSQIYSLVDDKTIHDSFPDNQRDKERETDWFPAFFVMQVVPRPSSSTMALR